MLTMYKQIIYVPKGVFSVISSISFKNLSSTIVIFHVFQSEIHQYFPKKFNYRKEISISLSLGTNKKKHETLIWVECVFLFLTTYSIDRDYVQD